MHKDSLKEKIGLTLLIAATLLAIPNYKLVVSSINHEISVVFPNSEDKKVQSIKSLPVRIKIPSINLDTDIEYVGLTLGGAVGTPKGAANVAWFDRSVLPGSKGSSIIDGHYGYKDRRPAAFDSLHKLIKGDKIYIKSADGVVTVFIVRSLKSYDEKASIPIVFNSTDGGAHLNLITCAGDWNPEIKSHSKRLVVFTDLLTTLD